MSVVFCPAKGPKTGNFGSRRHRSDRQKAISGLVAPLFHTAFLLEARIVSTEHLSRTLYTDPFLVIQHVLSSTSDHKPIPPRLRVAFRYPDGTIGPRDFLTHWLHAYPAKMFHRIPRQILGALDKSTRAVVLDPFCGSGTVLLEAASRGHKAVGVDVNPLARLLAEVKSTPLPPKSLQRSGQRLLKRARGVHYTPPDDPVFDFWFKAEARTAIGELRTAIDAVREPRYRRFFLITLSSIIRRCSLADPDIAPPVRLSEHRYGKGNAKYRRNLARAGALTGDSVYRLFAAALAKNIDRVAQLNQCGNLGQVRVLPPPAHAAATGLRKGSVDVIVTSPPYCGAQKYVRSVRLELLWLGFTSGEIATADRDTLGSERVSAQATLQQLLTGYKSRDKLIRKVWTANHIRAVMLSEYLRYLDCFTMEIRRVLRPGGAAFVTFGTSRIAGVYVDMAAIFRQMARGKGLRCVTTLIDKIPSRGLLTRRHGTANTISDEQVVWLSA